MGSSCPGTARWCGGRGCFCALTIFSRMTATSNAWSRAAPVMRRLIPGASRILRLISISRSKASSPCAAPLESCRMALPSMFRATAPCRRRWMCRKTPPDKRSGWFCPPPPPTRAKSITALWEAPAASPKAPKQLSIQRRSCAASRSWISPIRAFLLNCAVRPNRGFSISASRAFSK